MMHLIQKAAVIVLLFVVGSAKAVGPRVALPDDLFFYQPAASVFGSEAVWTNPAALNRYAVPSFMVMADYTNDKVGKNWGTVITGDRLATAYRSFRLGDESTFREYVVAGGFGVSPELQMGISYRHLAEGPGYFHKRHLWTVSALATGGSGKLAVASVLSNLNRSEINGEKSELEQRYSLAWRPMKDRVTVAADLFLAGGQKLSEADVMYHLEVVPTRGLYLSGSIDREKRFQVGLRANLTTYFLGSKSVFNKSGDHQKSTIYAGVTRKQQPSLLRRPSRRLVASLPRAQENPARPFLGKRPLSFTEITLLLKRASLDASVREVVCEIGNQFGFAQAQELRQAIYDIRLQGKRVICFLPAPSNISYYIASCADSICIPPVSQLNLVGLRAELTFYGATLNKIGVNAEMVRIGAYKSATETYTDSASSEANREQVNRLLDNLSAQFTSAIASGRNRSAAQVAALIDDGPYTADQALAAGLVDQLVYRDALLSQRQPTLRSIGLADYARDTTIVDDWAAVPTIAVVVVDGEIEGAVNRSIGSDESKVTPRQMATAVSAAEAQHGLAGVVLRIASPGGDAIAGEAIHRTVSRLSEKLPLVISMGNTAASGGYYIATPASTIFASPATITGSIGIFGGKLDLSGLYDKLALGKELYTRGRYAGMLTTTRPWNEAEREKYLSQLTAFYGHFTSLVSRSRKLSVDSVNAIGEGRIWTGAEAISNGLADSIGGVSTAIAHLAAQQQLRRYRIELFPKRQATFSLPGAQFLSFLSRVVGISSAAGEQLLNKDENEPLLLTRLPYDIEIR